MSNKHKSKKKIEDSFSRFLRNKGQTGIKSIAIEYAESDETSSFRVLAEKHCMPERLVKQIVEYAITHAVVSYQIASKIKEKSHKNQMSHYAYREETTSDKYYEKLFEKRFQYLKSNIAINEIFRIISCYINNPKMSLRNIAKKLGYNESLCMCTITYCGSFLLKKIIVIF